MDQQGYKRPGPSPISKIAVPSKQITPAGILLEEIVLWSPRDLLPQNRQLFLRQHYGPPSERFLCERRALFQKTLPVYDGLSAHLQFTGDLGLAESLLQE